MMNQRRAAGEGGDQEDGEKTLPSACVVVEIMHAEGIKDTQIFAPQDPYAIVTLLPSGTQKRTQHVEAGGTDPKWDSGHGNQLVLALAGGDTRLRIELWNLNTFVDDLIGSVELDLNNAACQDSRYELDTGGEVCCTISKLHEEDQQKKEEHEAESAKEQFRGAYYEAEDTEDKPVAANAMVGSVQTAGPAQAPDPLMETKQCVVQLGVVDLSDNRLFTCGSGSIVRSDGYILTAAHVVIPALTRQGGCTIIVGVWMGEGKPVEWRYTATVESDKAVLEMKTAVGGSLLDIALLKINKTVETVPRVFQGLNKMVIIKGQAPFQGSLRFLEHSINAPATGEQVCIFGYPKGTSSSDFGLKAHGATASISSDGEYIQVNSVNVAASGASGGPLLNKSGQVAGVLSLDYNDTRGQKRIAKIGGTNLSYFRPLTFLEADHHMPKDPDPNQSLVVKPPQEDILNAIEHAHERTQGKVASLIPLIQGVSATVRDEVRALGAMHPAEATAEAKAIAEEILTLLTSSGSRQLVEGGQHIKAENLEQALKCFKQAVQASESLPPDELAKAKKLLMYALFKLSIKHLQHRKYDQAAEQFEEILKQPLDNFSKERLQKLWLFHACALYEAGKRHREEGNWGEAKKRFEAAQKTNELTDELKTKTLAYIEDCKQKSKELRKKAKPAGKTEKINVDKDNDGEKEAIALYKAAKSAFALGNFHSSRNRFEKAIETGELPDEHLERAEQYMDNIDELKTDATKTANVFSDNCTHLLGSSTLTLGFATATLRLSTKTVSANRHVRKDMVMVLDEIFPAGSAERKKLIIQLTTDVKKALTTINQAAEIEIRDFNRGSVIVHFCFVNDEAGHLEEEYLRQVDDKESALYQGEVTCHIDQKRTQTMTTQLSSNQLNQTPCPYQVGDTITLAQVQEEKLECKVESLLGEGATATVFKVTTSGKFFALKVFKASNSLEDLCKEASLMLTTNHPHSHPNVIGVQFVWYEYEHRANTIGEMFFLMDLVDGDNLQEWMDDERLYMGTDGQQEARLISIAHQLACGLRHLHLRGILHKDVKPTNILMTKEGMPVLSDLGVSNEGTIENGRVRATLRGGTPVYASPHVRQLFFEAKALPVAERIAYLQEHHITHLDDFFSLGATVLDMFAECGWRRGQSVAEVLTATFGHDTKLRVAVPEGMIEVLRACFNADESLTVDSIFELTAKLCERPPSWVEGMAARRCAHDLETTPDEAKGMVALRSTSIRNNLGVALYDSGVRKQERGEKGAAVRCFDAASAQLERAVEAQPVDARALNNLGVVKWAQGEAGDARRRFDDALEAAPDHKEATFNVGVVQSHNEGAVAQVDRSGAAGAVEDGRGKVELASAVRFVPGQQLEVHRRGRWERIDAGDSEKPLLELTYRLPVPQAGPSYAPQQRLLVHEDGKWRYRKAQQTSASLNPTNHTPALFTELAAMSRAQQAYTIELKDGHAFILDLFSGQKLDTRTQTATLRYCEKERAAQVLSTEEDAESEEYQRRSRAVSVTKRSGDSDVVKTTMVLREMLSGDDRTAVRLRRYLLLILGPAASGKTTVLKTFIMEMVHRYADFVPVLLPIIEVVRVLDTCNRDEGESVITAFIHHKHPQHAHLLLQMMLAGRAVFLVDGIDESGTNREVVQDFITVELLEPGHKTIITSRHSGFSSDAFRQCRVVELLPLSAEQQAEMVRTRVLDGEKAAELVKELGTAAFKDIASNPLMLTMMVSVFASNNFVVISNRSDVYEKALRTLMGRTDKHRAGLGQASQTELFEHLQKLASASHGREGERRIFTATLASEWAGPKGWAAIEGAVQNGWLPIIVRLGLNDKDEEEYRFGHMSYQEYLTGRGYYQKLTASHFSANTMVELFGKEPQNAFADVKYHLVLELLAGILSLEQRATCLAVMAGGRVEEAAVTAKATVHGGDMLVITEVLGLAGAEALVPYLRGNTRLKTLVLRKAKLDANGMQVIAEGLKANATLTVLDVSESELEAEGAKQIAAIIPECKALSKLIFGGDSCKMGLDTITPESAVLEIGMTEVDLSNTGLRAAGAIIVGAWISHKDNGAMKTVTINTFALPIQDIKTKSELDFSGKRLRVEDAIIIAALIPLNGALVKFDIGNNNLYAEGTKAVAKALKGNNRMTKLNISSNYMTCDSQGYVGKDMSGVMDIANAILTMGALKKLLLAKNKLCNKEAGKTLATMLAGNTTLKELDVSDSTYYQCDSPGFAQELAIGVKNNGALTKLNMGANALLNRQAGKILGEMLKANSALKELNVSDSGVGMLDRDKDGPGFAQEIADGVRNNGAMKKLTISGDITDKYGRLKSQPVTIETSMTEADFSNKFLGASGATMLAAFLPKCRALETITFGDNQAVTMKTHMTKADFSGKSLEVSGAVVLAAFLPKCQALTSLNISNNSIGALVYPDGWKSRDGDDRAPFVGPDGQQQSEDPRKPFGAIALADSLKNNGALTSLNISDNNISHTQEEAIYQAVRMNKLRLAIQDKSLTELDVSGIGFGTEGAKVVAEYIKTNGALTSLNISNNNIGARVLPDGWTEEGFLTKTYKHFDGREQKEHPGKPEGAIVLAAAIKNNGALTSLNMSNNDIGQLALPNGWAKEWMYEEFKGYGFKHTNGRKQKDDPSQPLGAIALADAIKINRALTSINIRSINIPSAQEEAIYQAVRMNKLRLATQDTSLTELDVSGVGFGAEGALVVAEYIKNNRALTSLNMSNNKLVTTRKLNNKSLKIGEKATFEGVEWTVVSAPDSNGDFDAAQMGGVIALADAIKNNGAMTKLIFGGDKVNPWDDETPEPAVLEVGMTEADLSNTGLKAGGAIIVGAWISHKDNGALTSLNILKNGIQDEGLHAIEAVFRESKTLKSICGATSEKLDLSEQELHVEDAKIVAVELKYNGTMTSLNISNNDIGRLALPEGWSEPNPGNPDYRFQHTDGRHQATPPEGSSPDGAMALANAIKNNGALAKFDISNNGLAADGTKAIAEGLEGNTTITELNIANNFLGKKNPWSCAAADMSGVIAIGNAIPAMGALKCLNISNNNIGELLFGPLPKGWSEANDPSSGKAYYYHADTQNTQWEHPGRRFSAGVIALADAIKTNGALTSLNVSKNMLCGVDERRRGTYNPSGMTALADAIGKHQALTSLDLANNSLEAEGAKHIADAIKVNGALRNLNISNNNIGKGQAPDWEWRSKLGKYWDGAKFHTAAALPADMTGVVALADAIKNNRALASLNVSNNNLGELVVPDGWEYKKGGWFSGSMWVHSDGRKQKEKPEEPLVVALADSIKNNGALTSLDISDNNLAPIVGWRHEPGRIYEYHHSDGRQQDNKPDEPMGKPDLSGVIALADGIKNNGAMVTVNLMGNKIGKEQLSKLQEMMQAHLTLVSLCGIADDATEANLSGLGMDADDAVVLADELPAKRALTSLNISNNSIGQLVLTPTLIAEGWKMNENGAYCNPQGKWQGKTAPAGAEPLGVIALADAITNNGTFMLGTNVVIHGLRNSVLNGKAATLIRKCSDAGNGAVAYAVKLVETGETKFVYKHHLANGALASLDLSQNNIPTKELGPLERLCESKQIALRK